MNELDKGICRLSLINMYKESSFQSTICSQILFGEHYSILERRNEWLYIELYMDGEKGWIQADQHELISNEYFEQINNSEYKICMDITGNIFFKKKNVHILLGSILPIPTNNLFKTEEKVVFNGASKSLYQRREADFFSELVTKYIHSPYHPGGRSPFGIDGGGLIQQSFKISGYFLKRKLKDQINEGVKVNSQNEIKSGDVIYIGKENPENAWIYISDTRYIGIKFGAVRAVDYLDRESEIISIRRFLY